MEDDWYDDEDDETVTVQCGSCGADVYEDAVQCPICNEYLSTARRGGALAGRPLWFVVLGLLGTAAVIWVLTTR